MAGKYQLEDDGIVGHVINRLGGMENDNRQFPYHCLDTQLV